MTNLSLPLTKHWSYTIIWMLYVIPSCVLSVDERYSRCGHRFSCGYHMDLYYPFWTPERKECGHPDFKVNCSGDFVEFSISTVKFRILEMNFESHIIRLARTNYLNYLCSQNPENATINQDVLPFSNDTKQSTFYYDCPHPMVDVPPNDYIGRLNCMNEIGSRRYFVSSPSHSGDGAIVGQLNASCERNVGIPVSQSALKTAEKNHSLEDVFNESFELSFNSECVRCVTSGGACGWSSTKFVCYCKDKPREQVCYPRKKSLPKKAKIGIGYACGFMGATLITGCLLCFMIRKRRTSYHPRHQNLKGIVEMKQYSYAEVKKITKSFSHTVGKGGFGTVYGGNLCDGRKVAVKILKDFKSNGEDFINEITSMSQTSHVNIVSLLGFCYEGSRRAIMYEFLENGSLDQFISKKSSLNLDVNTLYRIALGVARGLDYLHHGCRTRIVHFDIKPQNVLLDENLCPKVSDFGLAKLCEKRESILSLKDARGTIGYIAPEVFSRMYGRVSHKSDVYSYGMLVLEMIGAKNKEIAETAASNASSTYFPDWIYHDLEDGEHIWITGDGITREENNIAKKMILVGLWCIQPYPSQRPLMNKVVEMMEGRLDALEVPPKPYMQNSRTPLSQSQWLSEENSNNSELQVEKLFSA